MTIGMVKLTNGLAGHLSDLLVNLLEEMTGQMAEVSRMTEIAQMYWMFRMTDQMTEIAQMYCPTQEVSYNF